MYYRIGEVSRLVGVAPHVLRYWESEFRSVRPQKSSHGQRVYSKKDVQKLLTIKDLLKSQGFTIEGARKRLREMGSERGVMSREVTAPDVTAPQVTAPDVTQPAARSPVSPPVDLAASRDVSPSLGSPPHAKRLRSALTHVRAELVQWLGELETVGAAR